MACHELLCACFTECERTALPPGSIPQRCSLLARLGTDPDSRAVQILHGGRKSGYLSCLAKSGALPMT